MEEANKHNFGPSSDDEEEIVYDPTKVIEEWFLEFEFNKKIITQEKVRIFG